MHTLTGAPDSSLSSSVAATRHRVNHARTSSSPNSPTRTIVSVARDGGPHSAKPLCPEWAGGIFGVTMVLASL